MTEEEFFLQAIENTFYVKCKDDVLDLLYMLVKYEYVAKANSISFGYYNFNLLKDFDVNLGHKVKQYKHDIFNMESCDSLTISFNHLIKAKQDGRISELVNLEILKI